MTRPPFKTGLIFASWALLLIFGCHKKKPPVPPEAQPPTISTSEQPSQPQPQAQPSQETQNPPATEQQQTATTQPSPEKPAPARKPRPHPPAKKTPGNGNEKPAATTNDKTTTEAKNIPPRVVIQEGGTSTSTPQVSSGQGEDNQGQLTTEQLLNSTEANLRNIKRQLSSDEQSMLTQIRDYITQSKQATKDGDLVRAHILAGKAHKLSDELVKAR